MAAEFFIAGLNKYHGLNYSVVANNNENEHDPEVDVYASLEGTDTLRIQVVTREGYLQALFAMLHKIARSTGQNIVWGPAGKIKSKNWIKDAILKKEGCYSPEVKRKLILLIAGEFGPIFNHDYAKEIFAEYTKSEFKGVYSVHLPSQPETSSHPHNGQIIAIKDIFGYHFWNI